jgi:hypothetical protein
MADFTLKNKTNNKEYHANLCQSFSPVLSQNVTDFNLPEGGPDDAQIIRMEGQKEEIQITIIVADNNIDKANGTHGSTVKTISEQLVYLRYYIFTKALGDKWTLTESVEYSGGVDGAITRLSRNRVAGNPNSAEASFMFIRGGVIG